MTDRSKAVADQLFAYANSSFSHDATQIIVVMKSNKTNIYLEIYS